MADKTMIRANAVALRISITDRCDLRCVYCMPVTGLAKFPREKILSFEHIIRFVSIIQTHFELAKIHITGGEPLVRANLTELVLALARETPVDMALTTNGQRLAEMAGDLRRAGLRRVNISLDSLRPETFARLTRGGNLARTIAGIQTARREGLNPIKLNTVVMRGDNDGELSDFVRFALENACQIRFLELMPIGCAKTIFHDRFVAGNEVRDRLEREFDLIPMGRAKGSSSHCFRLRDDHGRETVLGLISPYSDSFCDSCQRLRLSSDGRLFACLTHKTGFNIRPWLNDDSAASREAIREIIAQSLSSKTLTTRHCQPPSFTPIRAAMSQIGG
jgi:cyclic pyranopterin phosphate synthase